eukprot:6484048-Amphidinium_carterae.1
MEDKSLEDVANCMTDFMKAVEEEAASHIALEEEESVSDLKKALMCLVEKWQKTLVGEDVLNDIGVTGQLVRFVEWASACLKDTHLMHLARCLELGANMQTQLAGLGKDVNMAKMRALKTAEVAFQQHMKELP